MGESFRLHAQALVGYEVDIEVSSNVSTPSMTSQGADDNDESVYWLTYNDFNDFFALWSLPQLELGDIYSSHIFLFVLGAIFLFGMICLCM